MISRSLLLKIFKVLGSGTRLQDLLSLALGPLGVYALHCCSYRHLVLIGTGKGGQSVYSSQCTVLSANPKLVGRRDVL